MYVCMYDSIKKGLEGKLIAKKRFLKNVFIIRCYFEGDNVHATSERDIVLILLNFFEIKLSLSDPEFIILITN